MINEVRLKESIYEPKYFRESPRSLRVSNEQATNPDTLRYVEMTSNGVFLNIDNQILKEGCRIYQSDNRPAGRISFKRDCDGIFLLEVEKRKLLIVVEVKSGFNEVKKKGFEQLVASYIKTRAILQTVDGYNPAEYEELGILVSYPPSGAKTAPTDGVTSTKSSVVAPSPLDQLNNINATKLSVENEVTLDLNDYKIDACHLNPSLYNRQLRVKHIPVANLAESETIDLDMYI